MGVEKVSETVLSVNRGSGLVGLPRYHAAGVAFIPVVEGLRNESWGTLGVFDGL